ncbi:dipeptide ABC transporter ATP-binding protein [Neobacillus niacini]|uniref:ABC transporter ATP-binding protein n=1 Tax=Neobacillus niacini TaxID=86668 RepID=UPI003001D06B
MYKLNGVENSPILEIRGLKKHFPLRRSISSIFGKKHFAQAVNDVSFNLYKGETYGLVGESGCGKSTTGRTILRLTEPTEGEAIFREKDIFKIKSGNELKEIRKKMQMVFQDPYNSLNPRKRVGQILEESLIIHSIGDKKHRAQIVLEILEKVGLSVDHYYRYPHEFSGGQRQRIGLARALVVNPNIIIFDEPVSALDVSIQSQIINLLNKIQMEENLTYLFISHDMSVIKYMSDRVGVMYLGKLVEEGTNEDIFHNPVHPYTQSLLSAVPVPSPHFKKERIILKGDLPSPINPPSGCSFHTRCPYAKDICQEAVPEYKWVSKGHRAACHLAN